MGTSTEGRGLDRSAALGERGTRGRGRIAARGGGPPQLSAQQVRRLRARHQRGCVFCDPDPCLVTGSSGSFTVLADPAPLLAGHVLIVSRQHWECGGAVPAGERAELGMLMGEVRSALEGSFGAAAFFEHGRAGSCAPRGFDQRLCHHFHLHALPLRDSIADRLSAKFNVVPFGSYVEALEASAKYGGYLYFEAADGRGALYPANRGVERHLLRTAVAERINAPERADWMDYPDDGVELLNATLARLFARVPSQVGGRGSPDHGDPPDA